MRAEIQALSAKIAQHLNTQRARAMGENSCVYKAEDGKMCAVGCLIDEDKYHAWMEGTGAYNLGIVKAISESQDVDLTRPPLATQSTHVMGYWQKYHDSDVVRTSIAHSYQGWLDGEKGALSPDEFHEYLLKEFS